MSATHPYPSAGVVARANVMARLGVTWLDAVVLCAVFACGLLHLPSGFAGDQYLYLVGAQKIALHHGVMYRDFWDLKQPLIYYMYALGGSLFGFTQSGIHLFEALYQTLFAAVLIAVCRARLRMRTIASVVPLLAIVPYDAFATNDVLTSVEAFGALPIFIAAAFAADAFAGGRGSLWKALAAGVAGALAATLKLTFLPLVAVVWVVAALCGHAADRRSAVRVAACIGAGFVLVLASVAAYFAAAGVLDVALRTAFVDPPAVLHQLRPGSHSPLGYEIKQFALAMWPLIVLAAVTVPSLRRRPDPTKLQMLTWIAVGAVLIALQTWSFYYKFFIIVAPLGVLAAYGLEQLLSTAVARGRPTRLALACAVGTALLVSAASAGRLQHEWPGWIRADQERIAPSVAFLDRAGALPGAIYVLGNPQVYVEAARDQAVPINGWSPELLLPAQWDELQAELAAAKPPYIMVENGGVVPVEQLVRATPRFAAFIAADYRATLRSSQATIYQRR